MVKFFPLPASEPGVYIVHDKVETLESSSDQTKLTGQQCHIRSLLLALLCYCQVEDPKAVVKSTLAGTKNLRDLAKAHFINFI